MKNLLLFVIIICVFCRCKKKEPETLKGNYFYCKVNNKVWMPDEKQGVGGTPHLRATLTSQSLNLSAKKGIEDIAIYIFDSNGVHKNINYVLKNDIIYHSTAFYSNNFSIHFYRTDSLHTGTIKITNIDRNAELVEGTFSFEAYNAYTHDSVSVTNGAFSIHYSEH